MYAIELRWYLGRLRSISYFDQFSLLYDQKSFYLIFVLVIRLFLPYHMTYSSPSPEPLLSSIRILNAKKNLCLCFNCIYRIDVISWNSCPAGNSLVMNNCARLALSLTLVLPLEGAVNFTNTHLHIDNCVTRMLSLRSAYTYWFLWRRWQVELTIVSRVVSWGGAPLVTGLCTATKPFTRFHELKLFSSSLRVYKCSRFQSRSADSSVTWKLWNCLWFLYENPR